MIVTIHQPLYMPWLGYFHKLESADLMIILDEVPYSRGDFVNRNRILRKQETQLITVPVSKFKFGTNINKILMSGTDWKKDHLFKIRSSYSNTQYFDEYYEGITSIIDDFNGSTVSKLDVDLIKYFMMELGITTEILLQSELMINAKSSELIEKICQFVDADKYISGSQGLNYLIPEHFEDLGIELLFQEYSHPEYSQGAVPFVSQLSVLDLLFRQGPDSLKTIMTPESKLISANEKRTSLDG